MEGWKIVGPGIKREGKMFKISLGVVGQGRKLNRLRMRKVKL